MNLDIETYLTKMVKVLEFADLNLRGLRNILKKYKKSFPSSSYNYFSDKVKKSCDIDFLLELEVTR